MSKKSFAIFSFVTISVALATPLTAQACNTDYVAAEAVGSGNSADIQSSGTNYTSLIQNGVDLAMVSTVKGKCNAQVTGQDGENNRIHSRVRGVANATGVLQDANDADATINSAGFLNGIAIYQHRNGGKADVGATGDHNVIVINQN